MSVSHRLSISPPTPRENATLINRFAICFDRADNDIAVPHELTRSQTAPDPHRYQSVQSLQLCLSNIGCNEPQCIAEEVLIEI